MKTMKSFGTLFIFLCVSSLIACSNEKENEEGWYDRIPNGGTFLRANTLQFYYIDENGKSLINLNDSTTFPISCSEEIDTPLECVKDYDKKQGNYYNGNSNGIYLNQENGLYYFTTTAYGDERQSTYSFPVYVNGEIDKIEVTYKYTNKDVSGGKYWAKITSWKYNGIQVYSDDDQLYKKIFIKKSKGKTTVTTKD